MNRKIIYPGTEPARLVRPGGTQRRSLADTYTDWSEWLYLPKVQQADNTDYEYESDKTDFDEPYDLTEYNYIGARFASTIGIWGKIMFTMYELPLGSLQGASLHRLICLYNGDDDLVLEYDLANVKLWSYFYGSTSQRASVYQDDYMLSYRGIVKIADLAHPTYPVVRWSQLVRVALDPNPMPSPASYFLQAGQLWPAVQFGFIRADDA
jgi:hypothetical protein